MSHEFTVVEENIALRKQIRVLQEVIRRLRFKLREEKEDRRLTRKQKHVRAIEQFKSGTPISTIAKNIGMKRQNVHELLVREGLHHPVKQELSNEEVERMIVLWNKEQNITEVSRLMHRNRNVVAEYLIRLGKHTPRKFKRREVIGSIINALVFITLFFFGSVFAEPLVFMQLPQKVSGVHQLKATASDVTTVAGDTECGLKDLQFYLNGVPLGPALINPTVVLEQGPYGVLRGEYTYDWDTRGLPNGKYEIRAIARDKSSGVNHQPPDKPCNELNPNVSLPRIETTEVDNTTVPPPPTNTAPTISTMVKQDVTFPATAVFSATITDDGADGGNLIYAWKSEPEGVVFNPQNDIWGFGRGTTFPSPYIATTEATPPGPGVWTIKLEAYDGSFATISTVLLDAHTGQPQNTAPVIGVIVSQTITLPETASFTALVTDDGQPPTGGLTYQWSAQPAGLTFSQPTAQQTQVTASKAGTYTLTFTASDGALSDSKTVTLTAKPALPPMDTQPPSVKFKTANNYNFVSNDPVIQISPTDNDKVVMCALLVNGIEVSTQKVYTANASLPTTVTLKMAQLTIPRGKYALAAYCKDPAGNQTNPMATISVTKK